MKEYEPEVTNSLYSPFTSISSTPCDLTTNGEAMKEYEPGGEGRACEPVTPGNTYTHPSAKGTTETYASQIT